MNQCHANQISDYSAVSREQTLRGSSSQMEGQSLNIVAFSASWELISVSERGGERVGGSERGDHKVIVCRHLSVLLRVCATQLMLVLLTEQVLVITLNLALSISFTLSQPFAHSLDTPLSPPRVHPKPLFNVVHSLVFSSHNLSTSSSVRVSFISSLYLLLLCSQHILPKGRDERKRLLICVFWKEGGGIEEDDENETPT